MIELSATRGTGLGAWIAWLEAERAATIAEPPEAHAHAH